MRKASNGIGLNSLAGLPILREYRVKRVSSYDRTGGNKDWIPIKTGETKIIADIKGPGCIKHIWIGGGNDQRYYLRQVLLRMFWDGETNSSVDCPLGDFFGVGHGVASNFMSLPLSMTTADRPHRPALNCWFPMPFHTSARIEIVNECEAEFQAFFYIDYEIYANMEDNIGLFHAKWHRENPCKAVKFDKKIPENKQQNLTGKENYIILKAEGKGHYVGCNLSVHRLSPGWFGEGDDMIFIDNEKYPPSFHGTGTEDYFCSSYEFPVENLYGPYHGVSLAGSTQLRDWACMEGKTNKWTVYRFHIEDPIPFEKAILVSIEHGHANNRSDDYSSVAYWYQKEPHREFFKMLPVKERLPRELLHGVTS